MDVQIARCLAIPGIPHTAAGLPQRHYKPYMYNPERARRLEGSSSPSPFVQPPLHFIALGLPLYSAGLESLRLRHFYAPPPRDRVDGGWSPGGRLGVAW